MCHSREMESESKSDSQRDQEIAPLASRVSLCHVSVWICHVVSLLSPASLGPLLAPLHSFQV
jgi:hypothetical protein